MLFNDHSRIAGQHAFLSASKHHWINYDDDKIARVFKTHMAAARGSALHAFANDAITLGVKLPRTSKTINMYVNDAIGFRMIPEQVLFYSANAFGTADAISYRDNVLRIHDLKTGETRTSFAQLEIYVAFFCLEYGFRPFEFETELRIYQSDEVKVHIPENDEIVRIMDKIISFDKMIEQIKAEAA